MTWRSASRRTRKPIRRPEQELQRMLMDWARNCRLPLHLCLKPTRQEVEPEHVADWLIHVPMGGKRTKTEGGILKGLGAPAGFPDLFLLIAVGSWHGAALELKAPGENEKPMGEQRVWLRKLQDRHYAAAWTDDLMAAKDFLARYVHGRLPYEWDPLVKWTVPASLPHTGAGFATGFGTAGGSE